MNHTVNHNHTFLLSQDLTARKILLSVLDDLRLLGLEFLDLHHESLLLFQRHGGRRHLVLDGVDVGVDLLLGLGLGGLLQLPQLLGALALWEGIFTKD